MKTTALICVGALLVAVAISSYWLGHQRASTPPDRAELNRTLPQSSPPPVPAGEWDYRTVVCTNQRQQMAQWNREGWAVLSVSGPLTQKDGTISQAARLRRAKQ